MLNRRTLIVAALATVATSAFAHPHEQLNAEKQGDIERQLAAFRGEIKDAIAAKDAAKLRAMYADSYTHTHGSGKMDGKDARIVALLAGDAVIETANVSELLIRVHGSDMAIMTGRSPFPDSQGKTYESRWMQVYTRSSGNWQIAASQATRLPVTA